MVVLLGTAAFGCIHGKAAAPYPDRVAQVYPVMETRPVSSADDAADDPAIWIHSDDPARSLILGTNKKAGLAVYNLQGEEIQFLPVGNVNNVDVRYGFRLESGRETDIAMATNRTTRGLSVWAIDAGTGRLSDISADALDTGMASPYGFCLYTDIEDGTIYAFANAKDGQVNQWKLTPEAGDRIGITPVRTFHVGSQTEGCVADDEMGVLYIGEENKGIWRYGARPADGDTRRAVDRVLPDGRLTADIEGLALYTGTDGDGYLVASIQGWNLYAVYDRKGDNAFRGFFRIAPHPERGIDGAEETDGLDVTSANLGGDNARGILVVQDGFNTDPSANQNFKVVPFSAIADALSL